MIECIGGGSKQLQTIVEVDRDFVGLEVFAPQLKSSLASDDPCCVAGAGRILRCSLIEAVVQNRARKLGVVRPGSAIQVVRADRHPHVVDDADLGVDVDRQSILLEVVDGDSATAELAETTESAELADPAGRSGQQPVFVGKPRNHHDNLEVGLVFKGATECPCDVSRPQVLIFDVDEATSASKRFRIGAGDASLAVRRKRVTADVSPGTS